MNLQGKKILITGATSGIGKRIALQAAEGGAHVILHGREQDRVNAVLEDFPFEHAETVTANIEKVSDIEAMSLELANSQCALDGLVVNAGIGPFVPVSDITEELYDQIMNTNLKGAFFTIKCLLPLMKRKSTIVVNGSVAAHKGLIGSSVYAASKAALRSMVRTMANEFAEREIRINVVNPGPIDTSILDKQGIKGEMKKQIQDQLGQATALGRLGSAAEVANVFLFLLSDSSAYMTGSACDVDGGFAQI